MGDIKEGARIRIVSRENLSLDTIQRAKEEISKHFDENF
jgi:hypothetical protein